MQFLHVQQILFGKQKRRDQKVPPVNLIKQELLGLLIQLSISMCPDSPTDLVDAIFFYFIDELSQADFQDFGGLGAIAAGCCQSLANILLLKT